MASTVIHARQSPPKILPSRPIPFHRPTQSASSGVSLCNPHPQARQDGPGSNADPNLRSANPVSAPSSPRRRGFSAIDALSPLEELNGFRLGPAIAPGPPTVSMDPRPSTAQVSAKKSPMSRRRYLRIDSDSDGSSGSMTATPNRYALQRSGSSGYLGANGKARSRNRTRSATSSPTTSSLRLSQESVQYTGTSAMTRTQPALEARPNRQSMIATDAPQLAVQMHADSASAGPSEDMQASSSLQYRNSRSQPDLPSQARSSPQMGPLGSFPPRDGGIPFPTGSTGQAPAMTAQQRQEIAARKAALEQWHEHSLWMLRNFGQGQGGSHVRPNGFGAASSAPVQEVQANGAANLAGSAGRKSPLRQATLPNLAISPLPAQSALPTDARPQARPLSSIMGAADLAAASILGFNPPPVQVPLRSLPSSRRASPTQSYVGPAPPASGIVATTSPERSPISPPPYTAASSPGEESLSPTVSDDGTAEDPADIGVMFTTRPRRRRGDASGGETSGDGGASSPGDGIFPSSRGRQPYEVRSATQKSRRGGGAWVSGAGGGGCLSANHRSDLAESENSALGLNLGRLDIPSGDESRYSGDRGILTTDNEDTVSGFRQAAAAASTDSFGQTALLPESATYSIGIRLRVNKGPPQGPNAASRPLHLTLAGRSSRSYRLHPAALWPSSGWHGPEQPDIRGTAHVDTMGERERPDSSSTAHPDRRRRQS